MILKVRILFIQKHLCPFPGWDMMYFVIYKTNKQRLAYVVLQHVADFELQL